MPAQPFGKLSLGHEANASLRQAGSHDQHGQEQQESQLHDDALCWMDKVFSDQQETVHVANHLLFTYQKVNEARWAAINDNFSR